MTQDNLLHLTLTRHSESPEIKKQENSPPDNTIHIRSIIAPNPIINPKVVQNNIPDNTKLCGELFKKLLFYEMLIDELKQFMNMCTYRNLMHIASDMQSTLNKSEHLDIMMTITNIKIGSLVFMNDALQTLCDLLSKYHTYTQGYIRIGMIPPVKLNIIHKWIIINFF